MNLDALAGLVAVFAPLSLAAVGGVASVFASIQHQSVDVQHWVTNREFVEIFAISRGTPGPGSMIVTLIGWKVSGWIGALLATVALYLPSSLLTLVVAKVWSCFRGRAWHTILQEGLAPVGIGLMIAGIGAILQTAGAGWLSWCVVGAAAVALNFVPKLHPLLLLLSGALIFLCVPGQ